jgi:D-glycero-D-manno-heptose 1,7-bisphosphate phosphatase
MKKACFLDRDGVLIVEAHYLSKPSQVEIIPGVPEALKKLKDAGYLIIVVTNQAGIARGYFPEDNVAMVHAEIDRQLKKAGTSIDAYYYCPHHLEGSIPELSINCECRKPKPGMFFQAAKDHDINLSESFMVGDKFSDIEAAKNAGCKQAVMVRTGHGKTQLEKQSPGNTPVFDNLPAAINALLDLK